MTLYKRPESSVWQYEFAISGKRYRGSTKTTDRIQATSYEATKRIELTEAAGRAKDAEAAKVAQTPIWDAAQSWLAATEHSHADRKGNLSQLRKLFGQEMHCTDGRWTERQSSRYGFSKTITIQDLTADVLETLRDARVTEGNSPGTIAREFSLLQSIVRHAGGKLAAVPRPLATPRTEVEPTSAAPRQEAGSGFTAAQYGQAAALCLTLQRSFNHLVTLRIAVGEPYRVALSDFPGVRYGTEPAALLTDQRLRLTMWAEVGGQRCPVASIPADAPDFESLMIAARAEAAYEFARITDPESPAVIAPCAPMRYVQHRQASRADTPIAPPKFRTFKGLWVRRVKKAST